MKPENVFQLEILSVFAKKRNLIIRLGFTLLLGLPLILVSMPTNIQVSGLLVLMIFITFFGSAVSFVRRRTEGHYDKIRLFPIPIVRVLGDMVSASAIIDCIQMGILLILFSSINFNGITLTGTLLLSGLFIINVLILDILGILLGFMVRNNSEIHLFGALGAVIIGFFSGLFPVHSNLKGVLEITCRWNPLSILRNNLIGFTAGPSISNVGCTIAYAFVVFAFMYILCMRIFDRGVK